MKKLNATSMYLVLPWWKSLLNVVLASLGILLASPFYLVAAIALKLESPTEPILYMANRVGFGFRQFPLYKFRTMTSKVQVDEKSLEKKNMYSGHKEMVNTYKEEPAPLFTLVGDEGAALPEEKVLLEKKSKPIFFKSEQDPRITKVGSFLRKTSIDELPQLFNILFGHMSVVGVRPLPLKEAERLTIDQSIDRFLASPGLTGPWQLEKLIRRVSEQERIELDLAYARRKPNFWYDLSLIGKTATRVVALKNI